MRLIRQHVNMLFEASEYERRGRNLVGASSPIPMSPTARIR